MEEIDKIKERFEYWEISRGAYILSKEYLEELKEFIFTGKSKTLCDFEDYKKTIADEKEKE